MVTREAKGTEAAVEGTVRTADGLALFWRAWLPRSPVGAIVLVHGLAEHSGRYGHVGRHFAGRSWATYALDTRGHGRSPGPRVHVGSFDEFVEDVRSMLAFVRTEQAGRPVFLIGHSQGGLVVLLHALRHPDGLPGVAVTSPFLDSHPSIVPSPFLRLTVRALRRVAPRLLVPSGVDASRVSRDPGVVEAYRNDPLVSRRVSAAWYAALRRAQAEVRSGAARLRVPALILASPDDRLVDPEAIQRFVTEADPGRVESSWWPGLSHELLNEPEQERVLERLDAWLVARVRTP
jgi:alpha-beta hydrolase superfamily lysophospholipase